MSSTVIGIISGTLLMFIAILSQGGYKIFIDVPSMMITFGGTLAATFISYPLPRVIKVFTVLTNVFKSEKSEYNKYITLMINFAIKARQNSILSLEPDMQRIKNRMIRVGLQMVIDGSAPELIRDVLETETEYMKVRHSEGEQIFRTMAKLAPAFGMIGTLIGLVAMLRNMATVGVSPETLGPSMGVAIITTFYGALLSNLFCIPIAEKLRSMTDSELLLSVILIEGILLIQQGINPRIVEKKLNAYLPPEMRKSHYVSKTGNKSS